jgi:hypothetical protein
MREQQNREVVLERVAYNDPARHQLADLLLHFGEGLAALLEERWGDAWDV